MNTVCQSCVCVPLPQREQATTIPPRWASIVGGLWASLMPTRRTRLSESQLTALDGLSANMLKDIGAPEWLQEQTQRQHDRARQGGLMERDTLHWR